MFFKTVFNVLKNKQRFSYFQLLVWTLNTKQQKNTLNFYTTKFSKNCSFKKIIKHKERIPKKH